MFQDYTTSANPRFRIRDIIGEGLTVQERREGKKLDRKAETSRLLELVGLPADFADRFPHELSGGECQRAAIARAMSVHPEILICDEATSALDVKAESEVQKALDNLSIGRTVLVVAHRLSTIKGADRIAVIDNGIVAECGSHDELLKKDGLYAKLQNVHSQQGGEAL